LSSHIFKFFIFSFLFVQFAKLTVNLVANKSAHKYQNGIREHFTFL